MLCRSCNTEKDISEFPTRVQTGVRKYSRCKHCDSVATGKYVSENKEVVNSRRRRDYPKHHLKQRNWALKRNYGINLEQWNAMFDSQGMCCAICQGTDHRGRGWCTDHDHSTGVVREILCQSCNSMIGYSRETTGILASGIKYLEKHKAKETNENL